MGSVPRHAVRGGRPLTPAAQRAEFAADARTAVAWADFHERAGNVAQAREKLRQAAGLFRLAGDADAAAGAEERMKRL